MVEYDIALSRGMRKSNDTTVFISHAEIIIISFWKMYVLSSDLKHLFMARLTDA